MGRKAAAKDEVIRLTLENMDTALFAKGDSYDEAPGAYKDIVTVMNDQQDLVAVTHTLRPLAVIKRDGLITCGNEDVEYLNEQADYYKSLVGANPLSKLMRQWAQTWGYDDDTLNQMTEEYMDGGSY